jgi:hypothetical protein
MVVVLEAWGRFRWIDVWGLMPRTGFGLAAAMELCTALVWISSLILKYSPLGTIPHGVDEGELHQTRRTKFPLEAFSYALDHAGVGQGHETGVIVACNWLEI